MIISMEMHATRAEIDAVRGIVEHFGYKVHSIEGAILFATRSPNRLT